LEDPQQVMSSVFLARSVAIVYRNDANKEISPFALICKGKATSIAFFGLDAVKLNRRLVAVM
jgi:hypothetical protein